MLPTINCPPRPLVASFFYCIFPPFFLFLLFLLFFHFFPFCLTLFLSLFLTHTHSFFPRARSLFLFICENIFSILSLSLPRRQTLHLSACLITRNYSIHEMTITSSPMNFTIICAPWYFSSRPFIVYDALFSLFSHFSLTLSLLLLDHYSPSSYQLQARVDTVWANKSQWRKMCIMTLAGMGIFFLFSLFPPPALFLPCSTASILTCR